MKPAKNTTKDPEREVLIHEKKRTLKPWILETMIVDEDVLKKNSWYYSTRVLNVWNKDPWDKFLSVEQALNQLNKIGRSLNFNNNKLKDHWRFAGRELRLLNMDTQEIINLQIGDREIYVREN